VRHLQYPGPAGFPPSPLPVCLSAVSFPKDFTMGRNPLQRHTCLQAQIWPIRCQDWVTCCRSPYVHSALSVHLWRLLPVGVLRRDVVSCCTESRCLGPEVGEAFACCGGDESLSRDVCDVHTYVFSCFGSWPICVVSTPLLGNKTYK
jgi:hypothetical protein